MAYLRQLSKEIAQGVSKMIINNASYSTDRGIISTKLMVEEAN